MSIGKIGKHLAKPWFVDELVQPGESLVASDDLFLSSNLSAGKGEGGSAQEYYIARLLYMLL